MVKLVDTLDLKSSEQQCSCGFKSRSEYKKLQTMFGAFFILIKFSNIMGTFVVSKRFNGAFKFVFASRKGKVIFTSISCTSKSVCEEMIVEMKSNIAGFSFTKVKNAGGKYFFRLSREGLVLANSRKYTTELMLQKGIDEIVKYVSVAEMLDFSEDSMVFPDGDTIFEEQE
jgi:uncharacterized protein YegP (UPF0339 family)